MLNNFNNLQITFNVWNSLGKCNQVQGGSAHVGNPASICIQFGLIKMAIYIQLVGNI